MNLDDFKFLKVDDSLGLKLGDFSIFQLDDFIFGKVTDFMRKIHGKLENSCLENERSF